MSVSRHPVDELIRELVRSGRPATDDEIQRLIERIATVPFEPRDLRVRVRHRGIQYEGHVLAARSPSLIYHVVKRVLVEEQWADGTTPEEYLGDLRRAVHSPSVRLGVYERQGGPIATTPARTQELVSMERQGSGMLPLLLVVYSADRGIIVTGYQISGLETADIPEDARWLR